MFHESFDNWRHTEQQKSPETDLGQELSCIRHRHPSYPIISHIRRQFVHRTSGIIDKRSSIVYFNEDNSFACKHTITVGKHERSFDKNPGLASCDRWHFSGPSHRVPEWLQLFKECLSGDLLTPLSPLLKRTTIFNVSFHLRAIFQNVVLKIR